MLNYYRYSGATAGFLAILGLLAASWGCALRPKSAPWDDGQRTIAATRPGAMGKLTVETPENGSPHNGEQPHARFYVYDQSGQFFDYYNNDAFLPIGLPPGKYSVVTRYRGENKKVQVEILDGHSTYIRLEDFRLAPSIE